MTPEEEMIRLRSTLAENLIDRAHMIISLLFYETNPGEQPILKDGVVDKWFADVFRFREVHSITSQPNL